jgi:hypothetical protein
VRSEAAGVGLSVGQEGHAGGEDVIGEGTTVGVDKRLGFVLRRRRAWRPSAHALPQQCRPVLWARRGGPARTGVLAYLVARVIIPGDGRKSSIAENIAGEKHDAWSG